MGVLKVVGCIAAILLALAVVAGAGFLLSVAMTIGGALMALFAVGTIVVLGTTELYEKVIRRKRT